MNNKQKMVGKIKMVKNGKLSASKQKLIKDPKIIINITFYKIKIVIFYVIFSDMEGH